MTLPLPRVLYTILAGEARELSAQSRLGNLQARLDNHDAYMAELAADALNRRRAAFWTTAKYHNAVALMVVTAANRVGLLAGFRELEIDHPNYMGSRRSAAILDTILPLNNEAADELARAYTEAGTFRMRSELLARTDRAEGYAAPRRKANRRAA